MNLCRRFKCQTHADFVNHVMGTAFDTNHVPRVEVDPEHCIDSIVGTPIEVIQHDTIYADDYEPAKVTAFVKKIVGVVAQEVDTSKRLPEDFLIVLPTVSKNPLADRIELELEDWWKIRYPDGIIESNEPQRYQFVMFHKSEPNRPIDTTLSARMTRMVSIHSSKGDGRKVVIVVDPNEFIFKRYSNGEKNLVYESLLHVALTRQEEKLYITLTGEDEITARLCSAAGDIGMPVTIWDISEIPTCPLNKKIFKLQTLDNWADTSIEPSLDRLYQALPCIAQGGDRDKILVDNEHHELRYACMHTCFLLSLLRYEKENSLEHYVNNVFDDINRANIVSELTPDEFNDLMWPDKRKKKINEESDNKQQSFSIPIYVHNCDRDRRLHDILNDMIMAVRDKIFRYTHSPSALNNAAFCPLECLVFQYMLDAVQSHRQNLRPCVVVRLKFLYQIIADFDAGYTEHDELGCRCSNWFKADQSKEDEIGQERSRNAISNHFHQLQCIKHLVNLMCWKYPGCKWTRQQIYSQFDDNPDFVIVTNNVRSYLAFSETTVLIVFLVPQLSVIQFRPVLLEAIFTTCVLMAPQNRPTSKSKNTDRYAWNAKNPKKYVAVLLSFDFPEQPVYVNVGNLVTTTPEQTKLVMGCLQDFLRVRCSAKHCSIVDWVGQTPIPTKLKELKASEKYCPYQTNAMQSTKMDKREGRTPQLFYHLKEELEEALDMFGQKFVDIIHGTA